MKILVVRGDYFCLVSVCFVKLCHSVGLVAICEAGAEASA